MSQSKYRIVFQNGLVVPAELNQQPFVADVLVSHDGKVDRIGDAKAEDLEDAARVIDAAGKWLLPGFVSAHSHFWQHGFPGHASDKTVNEWAQDIYHHGHDFSPPEFYHHTLEGASSHIRKGITTAFNFTYSPGFQNCVADRAQLAGALDSGIRFIHGFNLGGLSTHWSSRQSVARTRRFLEWASAFKDTGRYLDTMIANHGLGYDTDAITNLEADIMRQLTMRGHMHYLESPSQSDVSVERCRWQWLKVAGLISPDLILGHFVHPDPTMLGEAGSARMSISWNPMSNGRLGSGIADIPEYRKHNIGIGLGVDGEASSDRCDPFENMRMGLYSVRGRYRDPTVLSTQDVYFMHTQGAAEVLGVADKVGNLAVGKYADIVILEPPTDTSTLDDSISALVLSSGVEDIKAVYIGGVEYWPQRPDTPEGVPDWLPWTFPPE